MNVVAMVAICEPTEWTTYELTWEHNIKHGTTYLYLLFAHTANLSIQPATLTQADKLSKTYQKPFKYKQIDTHTHTRMHTHTLTHIQIYTHIDKRTSHWIKSKIHIFF